ncbi:MAG: DUF1688 family protein [Myxococcota bacterium]
MSLGHAGGPEAEAAAALLRPKAIRERCGRILSHVAEGKSSVFRLHEDRLEALAKRVAEVTKNAYPELRVPYHSRWNHIRAGGVDRRGRLERALKDCGDDELTRRRFEYVIVSVLLDAGAGPDWSFEEDGQRYTRSEGLAVAVASAFEAGAFASDGTPKADADGLSAFDEDAVRKAFGVNEENPLVGVAGRASLIAELGAAVAQRPDIFGPDQRLGGLFDVLLRVVEDGRLRAAYVLDAVLEGLGPIWPGRIRLGGRNLGDVWRHPAAGGDAFSEGLVPFHKLSQWLTYSLLEPLEWAGITISEIDELTGLAEYRNGGLFVDGGVLEVVDPAVLESPQAPESEAVVEWRASTVVLLDRIAPLVRAQLGVKEADYPLAKVLEGGTWQTGRVLATEARSDGTPPITLASDGTVF